MEMSCLQLPFKHESLLLDSVEERMTDMEKNVALQAFQQDLRSLRGGARPGTPVGGSRPGTPVGGAHPGGPVSGGHPVGIVGGGRGLPVGSMKTTINPNMFVGVARGVVSPTYRPAIQPQRYKQ